MPYQTTLTRLHMYKQLLMRLCILFSALHTGPRFPPDQAFGETPRNAARQVLSSVALVERKGQGQRNPETDLISCVRQCDCEDLFFQVPDRKVADWQ